MSVATFTKSGAKAATPVKLNKNIFGLDVKNHQLLKDAYLSSQASKRQAGAKVKTRGEVRGSTAKPWRQKGTGNARFGSKYNPIWRGGGVAFGPTGNQNFERQLSTKAKRQALKQVLSLAAYEDRIKVIDTFDFSEGKVKPAVALLKKLGTSGKTLLVVSVKDELDNRATNNIAPVKVVQANYLGVVDALNADQIIISKKSLEILNERLEGSNV